MVVTWSSLLLYDSRASVFRDSVYAVLVLLVLLLSVVLVLLWRQGLRLFLYDPGSASLSKVVQEEYTPPLQKTQQAIIQRVAVIVPGV